jgi:hypothetical protein
MELSAWAVSKRPEPTFEVGAACGDWRLPRPARVERAKAKTNEKLGNRPGDILVK